MPRLYDRTEYDFIRSTLPRAGVFVDIGANAGLYSLWAAAAVGSKGRVLAIEPNPEMIERLRFNIAANDYQGRIEIVPLAIGDEPGESQLWLDPSNLGGASLDRQDSDTALSVPVEPLLAVLTARGIDHIDIMKLDIEGYEDTALLPFLGEAPPALLPKAIIIEDSRSQWRVDLLSRLEEADYRLLRQTQLNLILIRSDT